MAVRFNQKDRKPYMDITMGEYIPFNSNSALTVTHCIFIVFLASFKGHVLYVFY